MNPIESLREEVERHRTTFRFRNINGYKDIYIETPQGGSMGIEIGRKVTIGKILNTYVDDLYFKSPNPETYDIIKQYIDNLAKTGNIDLEAISDPMDKASRLFLTEVLTYSTDLINKVNNK